jgi:Holliday junction resolvase RusA-like endonuclease
MTQSDRWRKRPAVLRYYQFKDDLKAVVKGTLEPQFEVVFYLPMPKTWSKKKRLLMNGYPHQQKPDVDNLVKALMDALCEDDSYVYDVRMRKFWAESGTIELTEMSEERIWQEPEPVAARPREQIKNSMEMTSTPKLVKLEAGSLVAGASHPITTLPLKPDELGEKLPDGQSVSLL